MQNGALFVFSEAKRPQNEKSPSTLALTRMEGLTFGALKNQRPQRVSLSVAKTDSLSFRYG